jgi:hypothetical protein
MIAGSARAALSTGIEKAVYLGGTVRELYRLKRMNTRKPIAVCITIDTEFSIGGN